MAWRIIRRRRRRKSSITQHYLEHKEEARVVIMERLEYWNEYYGFKYNRVAIRNTRSCWGSCTSLKNLNFSYKLMFLPRYLMDYIIVHELCHLKELNHKQKFWDLVAECIPNYQKCIEDLKQSERSVVTPKRVLQGR